MAIKRVTSEDVAKQAGVSRTTVSMVLNNVEGIQISDETRQRVLDIAAELGYVPNAAAQALASRRSQIIGLVIIRNREQVASDAFLNMMLNGLVQIVQERGMRLLIDIIEQQHQKESYLQLVRAKRIDGIILAGPRFDDVALQALVEQSFPTVLIGELPGVDFPSVDVENVAAAKMAVAHLINLGHRRIACITNAQPAYNAALERLQGYRAALEEAGLPYDETLVRLGDFDPQSGYLQMNSLLKLQPMPNAVFIASDVVAMGALSAIHEHDLRIPEDIAIVGYDDVEFARFTCPPLTTVHLPAEELGRKSGELLFETIQHNSSGVKHLRLKTQLVVRQSCGAALA